jgi:hypothetical protein
MPIRTPYQRTILSVSVAASLAVGFLAGVALTAHNIHPNYFGVVVPCDTDSDCEAKNPYLTGPMWGDEEERRHGTDKEPSGVWHATPPIRML